MAVLIKDLRAFKDACLEEFLAEHPEVCQEWLQHFGQRLDDIRRGVLDERDFSSRWQGRTSAEAAQTNRP